MSQEFDAIYERGVFHPLERVDVPEQAKVHLHIREVGKGASSSLPEGLSAQAAALQELLAWVDSRPSVSTSESVSARDHDRILYGREK
jgi:predicted DNA-binding antitoxin AbrB/MazE fold protein